MATGVRFNCTTGEEETYTYTPGPDPVPLQVSNFQFRAALRASGRAAAFKTYYNSLAEDAQEEWQFRPAIDRNSAMVEAARVALGVTNNQLNTLFQTAASLL